MSNFSPRYLIGYCVNFTEETPPGSILAAEPAEARLKFDGTRLLLSISEGDYAPIATGVIPANPWVLGGNSFGANGLLGTNDGFPLVLRSNNLNHAWLTTTGEFLVGYSAQVDNEKLGVLGNFYTSGRALIGTSAFSGSETLKVHGWANIDENGAKDAALQLGKGSLAAVSQANHGAFRYEEATDKLQASENGGPYYDIITSSSLPGTAYVQGGNTFGALAVLGTNDANDLAFETFNVEKARLTTGGHFIVGATSTVNDAIFRATQSVAGTATTKYVASIEQTVTGTDTGYIGGEKVTTTAFVDAPSTQGSGAALNVAYLSDGSGAKAGIVQAVQIANQVQSTALGAAGAVTTQYGISSTVGYASVPAATSGAITNAYHLRALGTSNTSAARTITNLYGVRVDNQGATGVTNAYGIDVLAQSGAATTNIGIRSQGTAGAAVFGTTALSGTEAVRVAGNGLLADGSNFTVSATSTATINNSGGAINVGNNADAQAINLGTGAAARTITIGNTTGATSVVVNSGSGQINLNQRTNVKNASGLYILDGGGTNGVSIAQQSGTTHTLAGVGTTTTLRSSTILEMNANVTTLSDGANSIGTEALRFNQVTQKTSAVKTHANFPGSLVYEETGAIQTVAAGLTTIYTLALADNSGYWIEAFVVGRDTGSGNRGMFRRQICGYRQGGGGANTGGNATIGTDYNPGVWGGVQINTSGSNIIVQVNGAGATTINWVVTVRWQAVTTNV